jgi:hypothetical protein
MELTEEQIERMGEINNKYMFADAVTEEERTFYETHRAAMYSYCKGEAEGWEIEARNYE